MTKLVDDILANSTPTPEITDTDVIDTTISEFNAEEKAGMMEVELPDGSLKNIPFDIETELNIRKFC